jgi:hypothetical protein
MADLDFNNINMPVTLQEIMSKGVTEEDIFVKYCPSFERIGDNFLSELRDERNPSCRIYRSDNGAIRYKDFSTGDNYNCWGYIMVKYNCTYSEALNIVGNDFNIKSISVPIEPRIIVANDQFKLKEKAIIEIDAQPFNFIDYEYWEQYGIDINILKIYNVVSAKYTYLTKGSTRHRFDYSKKKPRYAYIFKDSVKVYSPYGDKIEKWIYSGDLSNIEGYDQLDEYGDLLIITKSLKDVMVYHKLDINAISLPSESSRLTFSTLASLKVRFKRVIVNMDNDKQGVISTNKIIAEHSLYAFYIDNAKDLSDYVKEFGIDKAKEMINKKINE